MESAYEEIIRIDDIIIHIKINNPHEIHTIYLSSGSRLIYRIDLFVFDDYMNYYVYEGNGVYLAENYPAWIGDLCEAVANVVKAHNSNEINLW